MTKNPNEYSILGNIAYIFLCNRRGKRVNYAMVDPKNLEKVLLYRWHLNGAGYAEDAAAEIAIAKSKLV